MMPSDCNINSSPTIREGAAPSQCLLCRRRAPAPANGWKVRVRWKKVAQKAPAPHVLRPVCRTLLIPLPGPCAASSALARKATAEGGLGRNTGATNMANNSVCKRSVSPPARRAGCVCRSIDAHVGGPAAFVRAIVGRLLENLAAEIWNEVFSGRLMHCEDRHDSSVISYSFRASRPFAYGIFVVK